MISRDEERARLEEADRKFGRESLFYLSRFNLGYTLLQNRPHKAVCSHISGALETDGRILDLEPRGTFKTTISSQSLPVLAILRNPNIRILLDSGVLQNSVDNLGVIKRHFESEKFNFLYGSYVGDYWTTEEITISKRTRTDLKEPTIRVSSPERMQTGPHYDLIISDDVVSPDNVSTPEQRQKIKDHIRLYWSLLDPGGSIVLLGTRWHDDDAYGMIIEEYPEFKKRIKDAETGGPNGGLYFPERLSAAFLQERKTHMKRDLYNSQYKNDPAPQDADSKFQRVWFKGFKDLPEALLTFVTVDPGGEHKGNDDWVFFLSSVDPENQLYFRKVIKRNMRMSEAWDIAFQWFADFKFLTLGLETTGAQKYLMESLNAEMRRRNIFFNVQELKHAGESKLSRIMNLEPRYRAGAIFHSNEMSDPGSLEDQLLRIPKGKDDVADAAAMVLEVAVAPRSKRRKVIEIKSVDDLIWRSVRDGDKVVSSHPVLGSEK